MLEVEIGPIETELYKPGSLDRFFVDDSLLGRVTRRFCGGKTINLCRRMMAGGDSSGFSEAEAKTIDTYFFRSSRRIYNLPKEWTPQTFYSQSRYEAITAIQYFGLLVPELAEDFELRDEIAQLSDRPSDLLRLLASPPKSINPTLTYETQRHAIVQYQLGMIKGRALNEGLRNILSDVQQLLNEELLEGPVGDGEHVFLESFHDDETNQVVGFPDRNDRRPLTAHLKRLRLVVRKIPEVGSVHKKPREKAWGPTIVKSWVKALKNGGAVHVNDAIQDSIGMRFVLMDDSVPPEQLADLVVSAIKSGIESRLESNHQRKIPNIAKVEKDDETGTDHGQSTEINFNARRKIWFDGIQTPIELIFYNREVYLNSRFEVGKRNPETGLHMGRSHDLFDLRKVREIVRVPFPETIFPVSDYDLNAAFVNRDKQVAYGLINMYKAS